MLKVNFNIALIIIELIKFHDTLYNRLSKMPILKTYSLFEFI